MSDSRGLSVRASRVSSKRLNPPRRGAGVSSPNKRGLLYNSMQKWIVPEANERRNRVIFRRSDGFCWPAPGRKGPFLPREKPSPATLLFPLLLIFTASGSFSKFARRTSRKYFREAANLSYFLGQEPRGKDGIDFASKHNFPDRKSHQKFLLEEIHPSPPRQIQ